MYSYTIDEHELRFIRPARTSRNVFETRLIYLITITDHATGRSGRGEAAPLSLLSTDDRPDYRAQLERVLDDYCASGELDVADPMQFPSIRFALETAWYDMGHNGEDVLFDTPFTRGEVDIPINGLVWMNSCDEMLTEAFEKIEYGFDVIKFKVGGQDFDEECRMLEKVRERYSAHKVTVRLDANGAFKADEAMEQLRELSRFEIHSIEQPIATQLWDDMARLTREAPIPIALDEELIGLQAPLRNELLNHIRPQYIILKPNLIGGLMMADEWVGIAHKNDVKWWATSALEGNVGLNAIAQWVSRYGNPLHQGLGTGSLYSNNIPGRLHLYGGRMHFMVGRNKE